MGSNDGEVLLKLISQDFTVEGGGRWYHAKEHDSLVIDAEKGMWFWNSKGMHGTSYTWLVEIKGFSDSSAREYLKQYSGYTDTFIHNISNATETVVYPKLVDVFYENGRFDTRAYWYKRGFTDKTIQMFKLGKYEDWYTIPIYQDGLFRDFQLRRDDPKKISHYYRGVGRLLFNSDILKYVDTIYITEGPTDCIRLLQEGVPAISHNAGSEGWNPEWFKYFIYLKNIFVIYDNDNAGRTGALKVARNLGEYRTKIYTFDGFDDKYDVIDFFTQGFTVDNFRTIVDKEAKYAFELKGSTDDKGVYDKRKRNF